MSGDSYAFMTHTRELWAEGGLRAETAAAAILTLCKNVLEKPANLKYRRVPCAGAAFAARVSACPGALAVLTTCGFTRQTYPDGDYFVMHHVDADLLQRVVRELELGLDTFERLRAKRAAASTVENDEHAEQAAPREAHAASEEDQALADAMRLPPAPPQSFGASSGVGLQAEQLWSGEAQRQLAARSVVHRVAAREQQKAARRRQRTQATVCAALVVLAGLFLAANDFVEYFL